MKYCPKCKKSHYSVGYSSQTLMAWTPIYKDGVLITKNPNKTTTEYHCQECGETWKETE